MKDKPTEKEIAATLAAALKTEAGEKVLLAAMNRLFEDGKWEIPDEAVAGLVKNKVDQLEAQVKSLTSLLGQLSAHVHGKPGLPSGRVDPMESKHDGHKKKK